MDEFIDSIFIGIFTPILNAFETFINFVFSSTTSTLIFALLFMNSMGFLLMYLDKKYAKEDKRRIKESTLFLTAILFGSLGIWAGMHKFRHKTLHKKFTIGVPLIIVCQIVFILYKVIKGVWL